MRDELNPPLAEGPDAYGSVSPMNGAGPPPPAINDARDNPLAAPIPGADPLQQGDEFIEEMEATGPSVPLEEWTTEGVSTAEIEPEDDDLELWTPLLAQHYDPPPQRWAVEGFFPHNEVVLFTGEGDLGKSTMLQQLQAA